MAGKLFTNPEQLSYAGESQVAPHDKRARAYAEGYETMRASGLVTDNPHGVDTECAAAWQRGYLAAYEGEDPGHVAGYAPPPPPEPEPDPEEPEPEAATGRRRRRARGR